MDIQSKVIKKRETVLTLNERETFILGAIICNGLSNYHLNAINAILNGKTAVDTRTFPSTVMGELTISEFDKINETWKSLFSYLSEDNH